MLSIIIPAYNAEKTISKCLDSILAQENCDYEIIIVNDLSTDETPKILEEYKNNYKNIKVIDKKIKTSISDVRNYGLSQATGNYVTFVDADDTLVSDKLFYSQCLSALSKYDSDALFFGYNIIEGEKVIPCPIAYEGKEGICIEATKEEIHNSIASYKPYDVNGYIWKAIFKRSNISIPVGLLSYEDMLFLHLFTKSHDRFLIYNKIGYNYFINPNSFVHQKNEYKSAIKDLSSIMVQRIISNNFSELKVVTKVSKRITSNSSINCYLHSRKLKDKSIIKYTRKELLNSLLKRKNKKGKNINLVLNLLGYNQLHLSTIYSIMAQRYSSYKLFIICDDEKLFNYYRNNLFFDERIIVQNNLDNIPLDAIKITPDMIFSYDSLLCVSKKHIGVNLKKANLSDQRFLFPLQTTDDEKLQLKEISFN